MTTISFPTRPISKKRLETEIKQCQTTFRHAIKELSSMNSGPYEMAFLTESRSD